MGFASDLGTTLIRKVDELFAGFVFLLLGMVGLVKGKRSEGLGSTFIWYAFGVASLYICLLFLGGDTARDALMPWT